MTTFARILGKAVAATPGAVGAAFAAGDGELVDASTTGDAHEWALLTAHYGVILAHLEAALGTKHFGGTEYFVVVNRDLEIAVHTIDDGYYALLAIERPGALARGLGNLTAAVAELRAEMR